MTSDADLALSHTLRALPAQEHEPLVAPPGAAGIAAEKILDPYWLREQIHLRGQRWHTDDRRVLATLWWYSASVWLPCPALASLVVTGRALSPALPDLTMHWWPDSRITGATSAAVLTGPEPIAELGEALRATFQAVIGPLAEAGEMKERPLWAIASDSLAGRLLWVGRAIGERERATALAEPLARAIGPRLPAPRYVDVSARPDRPARFVRRNSCCLLYAAPDQSKCSSCPKRAPEDRTDRLLAAAGFE